MGYPQIEQNTKAGEYEVPSLNFAAVLLCYGRKVLYTKPHKFKANLSVWVFEDDGTAKDLYRQYTARKLTVEPQLYWENVRALKDMALNNQ